MAKNERVYFPKEGNIKHAIGALTEANTFQPGVSTGPGILWKAGADGGKLYKLKLSMNGTTVGLNTDFEIFWSPDGTNFFSIVTYQVSPGTSPLVKELFVDFNTYNYLTDALTQKYMNVPGSGGYYVDIKTNSGNCDVHAYGEDY